MEINIKDIAGDYNVINELKDFWERNKPNYYQLNNIEQKNYWIIRELLDGVQTKYIDVKTAESYEWETGNTRSTKRTKQLDMAFKVLEKKLTEENYIKLRKIFEKYTNYVNFDKIITLKKSNRYEGAWEIKCVKEKK